MARLPGLGESGTGQEGRAQGDGLAAVGRGHAWLWATWVRIRAGDGLRSQDLAGAFGRLQIGHDRRLGHQALGDRDRLLAQQHAHQAQQGDGRRGGRADIEQRVDHADEQAGAQGQQVGFHGGAPKEGGRVRAAPRG
jgi:hypothetical protein